VFVALNQGELPVRERSGGELAERVRRAEDYALLGAGVVVELHSESHAAKPSTRAWAITRRAGRGHQLAGQRASRAGAGRPIAPAAPTDPTNPRSGGWWPMPTDPPPDHPNSEQWVPRLRDLSTGTRGPAKLQHPAGGTKLPAGLHRLLDQLQQTGLGGRIDARRDPAT
jgi:hypothetical protein